MWYFLKNIFFLFDAEKAHYLSMDVLRWALRIPGLNYFLKKSFYYEDPSLEVRLQNLTFKNPVGLAAGFDKDGKWLDILAHVGFGFIELGTVTPKAQNGNPKPRLFRLVRDRAIINRMGFNNDGVDALAEILKNYTSKDGMLIGGNIGKNKDTTLELAHEDYLYCFEKLFPYVDYFVVNVSSPNTPNLRSLQEKEPLRKILHVLQNANQTHPKTKPIFLKISPDLTEDLLKDILEVVNESKLAGLVVNNTSIQRPDFLLEKELALEPGGLSGAPITNLSNLILQKTLAQSTTDTISVGGIMSVGDAKRRLFDGAKLIQIYTGMIYNGPWFCKEVKKSLNEFYNKSI
ncbi:MAG: quinone-dependent dihydroorotate dehydrogenase [Bacteroidota bacterium]|nr:quinone-dependent dihydroorotate dehydrogenase [Bacteroidota bacterium]